MEKSGDWHIRLDSVRHLACIDAPECIHELGTKPQHEDPRRPFHGFAWTDG
jgi:hypothetical protein